MKISIWSMLKTMIMMKVKCQWCTWHLLLCTNYSANGNLKGNSILFNSMIYICFIKMFPANILCGRFEIPDFKAGAGPGIPALEIDKPSKKPPGVPPKRTTIPENAESMHPTTLLCMVSQWMRTQRVTHLTNCAIRSFICRWDRQSNMSIWAVKVKCRTFYIALGSKWMVITSLAPPKIKNLHANSLH